jgi:hypothetical protein
VERQTVSCAERAEATPLLSHFALALPGGEANDEREAPCADQRNFAESQLQRQRQRYAPERGKAESKVVPSI